MRNKIYIFFTLIIISFTLSCGFLGQEEPSEEPVRVKVDPLATDVTNGGEAQNNGNATASATEGLAFNTGLETLSAYRILMSIKRGEDTSETIYEKAANPAITRLSIATDGIAIKYAEDSSAIEVYETDGVTYVRFSPNEPWILFATVEETLKTPELAELVNQLGNIPPTTQVSSEVESVNGVSVHQYSFDNHDIDGIATNGTIWVAEEGGYIVKYEANSIDATIPLQIIYDLSQPNGNFTIALPEDTAEGTKLGSIKDGETAPSTENDDPDAPPPTPTVTPIPPPDDVPIMPEAENLTSTGDKITYHSPRGMGDAFNFYYLQLPAKGWVEDEAQRIVNETAAKLIFDKDGKKITVELEEIHGGVGKVNLTLE